MNREERRRTIKLMQKGLNLPRAVQRQLVLTCCGKEAPCSACVTLPFVLMMEEELMSRALSKYGWKLAENGGEFTPLCPECQK